LTWKVALTLAFQQIDLLELEANVLPLGILRAGIWAYVFRLISDLTNNAGTGGEAKALFPSGFWSYISHNHTYLGSYCENSPVRVGGNVGNNSIGTKSR
jgi:hypothetical protein